MACATAHAADFISTAARGRGSVVENTQAVDFMMRNIMDTAVLVSVFYNSADRTKTMSRTGGFRWR
jgi:hypothetical protein